MTASVVVAVAVVVLAASLPTLASSSSSSSSGGDGGHLTLGDLESSTTTIMRSDGESGPISIDTPPLLVVGRGAMFGSGCRPNANAEEEESVVSPDARNANASRPRTTTKSPRRAIKLDLSGRVMCHVVGPRNFNNNGGRGGDDDDDDYARHSSEHLSVVGESIVPLISIEQRSERRAIVIPRNVYLGADYDLDEVWYGATRWIGRCSWGPFATWSSSSPKATSGNDGSPASFSNRIVHSADRFRRTLFPPSSSSSWIVDAEGEKSVFDRSDSTVRLRLIQSPGRLRRRRRRRNHPPTDGARRISVEYDSAKYDDTDDDAAARGGAERRRRIRYAPAVVVDFTTPMFHPRLEARSRHTWVVRSGGDRYGNYYGGDHYGDSRSPVDRRMDRIRTRMRDGVPRSNPVVEAGRSAATTTTTNGGGVDNFRNRLSRWLENDGWMPRRATVDLMGNLVSVNEVGFGHPRGKVSGGGLLDDDGDDERTENSRRRPSSSSRGIFPHVRDAGIRLRVSKRVDWTSVGIFPWSKNNDASSGKKRRSGDDGFLVDALRSAHVRLDLCGAYGPEEDRCAAMSVGVDVDPLDWRRTLKVIVGREGVDVLGKG